MNGCFASLGILVCKLATRTCKPKVSLWAQSPEERILSPCKESSSCRWKFKKVWEGLMLTENAKQRIKKNWKFVHQDPRKRERYPKIQEPEPLWLNPRQSLAAPAGVFGLAFELWLWSIVRSQQGVLFKQQWAHSSKWQILSQSHCLTRSPRFRPWTEKPFALSLPIRWHAWKPSYLSSVFTNSPF